MWDPQFEEILRKYLPYLPAGEPISGDMSLFDAGLDSIGAAELLSVVERTYNVRFVDDALSMETFGTPDKLWVQLSSMITPPV